MSFGELRIPGLTGFVLCVLSGWRGVVFLTDGVLGVVGVVACRGGFGWVVCGVGVGLMFQWWLRVVGVLGEGCGTRVQLFKELRIVVKFAMESDALVDLGQRTQAESEDLGVLVRNLFDAAEPLAGQMNGPARAAFDKFKGSIDDIAYSLNSALAGIVGSISGQNKAFVGAAEDGAAVHASAEGAADFSAGVFLRGIGPC